MFPTISPLFGTEAVKDIRIKYLSHLNITEVCRSAQVCKQWFKLSQEKVIWVPIFKQLNPLSDRDLTLDKGKAIKSEVISDLQKNQERVDLIISLSSEDFFMKGITLSDLKKMLPIERTIHLTKALSEDCTQLLIKLLKKHEDDWCAYRDKLYVLTNDPEERARKTTEFFKSDKILPCWTDLFNDSTCTFDPNPVMTRAWALIMCKETDQQVLTCFAKMIKRHPNLSVFFETDLVICMSKSGPKTILPMKQLVSDVIIPGMERFDLGVSMQDWTKCGYKPD